MKQLITAILILGSITTRAQELQEINYRYLYTNTEPVSFQFKKIKSSKGWEVFFNMRVTGSDASKFQILWEIRKGLDDKGSTSLSDSLVNYYTDSTHREKSGNILLSSKYNDMVLAAKVVKLDEKRAWYYFTHLNADYPVNGYLKDSRGKVVFDSYLNVESTFALFTPDMQTNNFVVSYYSVLFPAGAPVFSEAMAPVTTTIRVDSTMYVKAGSDFTFIKPGNYLIQKDTNDVMGFSFTVYEDYPKYSYLESLIDPMIYVSTKNEFEKLQNVKGEKKAFDRVILSITGDTERARIFMRSYFKRVELANQFFSSFKAGWKTDRGMVYIIYGIPDEVYKFKDREVWKYKSSTYKASFDFVRSGTLFDPDNYVLIRDDKFKDTWYEVVDLWRNARF